jgi:spore maturation protein CgeB
VSEFGYDPRVHVAPQIPDDDRDPHEFDLVFVGHWEQNTARMIAALRKEGLAVKVWGHGWWQAWNLDDRRSIRSLALRDYAKVISSAKIALCFLSKWNRNESAGRTFEIPAIGGFLLAERTRQQAAYFVEGKEAEFFGSTDELIKKAKYYLAHDDERRAIARAGHERCLRSPYTYKDRIERDIKCVLDSLSDQNS